jgi:hypothetical protein
VRGADWPDYNGVNSADPAVSDFARAGALSRLPTLMLRLPPEWTSDYGKKAGTMTNTLDVVLIVVAGLMVGNELAIATFIHPTLDRLADEVHIPSAAAIPVSWAGLCRSGTD